MDTRQLIRALDKLPATYEEEWRAGSRRKSINEHGNNVARFFRPGDRYEYDFSILGQGWEQFDTDRDAHYFGVWVHLRRRMTLTYCEGDVTMVFCPTLESFAAELDSMVTFYGDAPPVAIAFGEDEDGNWTRTEYYADRPTVEEDH